MDTTASADRTNAFTFRRESETNTNLDHLPPEVEEWWVENVKSMYDLESSRDVFQAVLRLSIKQYVCVIEVGQESAWKSELRV
jgi:hypothetical protein